MVIDIHTHTFPDKIASAAIGKLSALSHTMPFTDGTVDGLAASMKQAGIDLSVVLPVATNIRQVAHVNDASARLNEERKKDGILSFGCIHPDSPDWKEELARIASLGLKGIKVHPVYQDVDFDDIRFLRILGRAAELDLIVITHAGLDIGFPGKVNVSPQMARSALRQVGPVQLILAHMGGWRNWDQVEELLTDTQVYLDTAFSLGKMTPNGDGYYKPGDLSLMEESQFLRMVRSFGAHRILFGTDSPWGGQKEDISLIRSLPLTAEEQRAILGENARKLLQLS